jgi:hypothetical protein
MPVWQMQKWNEVEQYRYVSVSDISTVYLSITQQEQFVKHVEYLGGGLMYCDNHCLAFLLCVPLEA